MSRINRIVIVMDRNKIIINQRYRTASRGCQTASTTITYLPLVNNCLLYDSKCNFIHKLGFCVLWAEYHTK